MTDTADRRTNGERPPRLDAVRQYANPATVKGAIGVVVGLVILLLPDFSIVLVEIAVGVGLAASGVYDLGWVALGRRQRKRGSRWYAAFRGLLALLAAVLIAASPDDGLIGLVGLVGLYLGIRGVVNVVRGLVGRDRTRRVARLAGGISATAFGVLAFTAPAVLTTGLIALGAMAATILGAIVLTFGLRTARSETPLDDPALAAVGDILVHWVRSADMGVDRRTTLADTLYFEQPDKVGKYTAWWIMLVLSVAIATFAVLQDSTAVVIGAMLVAPLMTPILALAGALVNGWRRRAGSSALLITTGVAAAIVLSYALSSWAPVALAIDTNTQITSRVTPNLLDMLIAIAAGAAGAFATVNPRASSSIAGVAIAVALVPPLSVVGIALGAGRSDDAFGAFLLFLTNFVAIVLAATLVFVLAGFVEGASIRLRAPQLMSTLAPFVALALVVLVPLVFNSQGILAASAQSSQAQDAVDEWLGEDSELQVEGVTVTEEGVEVEVRGSTEPPPLESLQESLNTSLGRDDVAVTVLLTPVVVTELQPSGDQVERRPGLRQ